MWERRVASSRRDSLGALIPEPGARLWLRKSRLWPRKSPFSMWALICHHCRLLISQSGKPRLESHMWLTHRSLLTSSECLGWAAPVQAPPVPVGVFLSSSRGAGSSKAQPGGTRVIRQIPAPSVACVCLLFVTSPSDPSPPVAEWSLRCPSLLTVCAPAARA